MKKNDCLIRSNNITLFSLPHFQIDQMLWPSGFEVAQDHYQLQACTDTLDLIHQRPIIVGNLLYN